MNARRSIDAQIALVERKLELRRERLDRHLRETRATAVKATSWLPFAAAAGALVIGFAAARPRRLEAGRPMRTRALFSTLLAAGGTAVRIALSPQVQALWKSRRVSGSSPSANS